MAGDDRAVAARGVPRRGIQVDVVSDPAGRQEAVGDPGGAIDRGLRHPADEERGACSGRA